MEKFLRAALLFDFYGGLLTGKQRRAYEMYFGEDLSLSEIADELGITRQGVRDLLRRSENAMIEYEKALSLVARHGERSNLIDEIITALRSFDKKTGGADEKTGEKINKKTDKKPNEKTEIRREIEAKLNKLSEV